MKDINQNIVYVDVIAEGLPLDTLLFEELEILINKEQNIKAFLFDGKNTEETIKWLKENNAEYKINEKGKIEIKIWGYEFRELYPHAYASIYEDGTFGIIEENEMKKTYTKTENDNYSKKIVAITGICVDKLNPNDKIFLDQWLGKNKYRFEKDGITIIGKEKEQFIKFGNGDYIVKDTTGDPYPKTKKNVDKMLKLTTPMNIRLKQNTIEKTNHRFNNKDDRDLYKASKAKKPLKTTKTKTIKKSK